MNVGVQMPESMILAAATEAKRRGIPNSALVRLAVAHEITRSSDPDGSAARFIESMTPERAVELRAWFTQVSRHRERIERYDRNTEMWSRIIRDAQDRASSAKFDSAGRTTSGVGDWASDDSQAVTEAHRAAS